MLPDWEIINILVALPAIYGKHKGENFALMFDILKQLILTSLMVAITADNSFNNTKLAKKVEGLICGKFQASGHLLGCMAHVINLAAHDSLEYHQGQINLLLIPLNYASQEDG
ncbi:uncharacterized protein VP01_129g11 [Puccinia sorghi]|uniref:HAT C-terminal dimerisation domain-containing protein n=1 Tax=Puccinia sorghi TaxID=27349 RepID=A0A0L6VN69_9BASI|nr:uncharacterized protein VP01_129g11 [Puccinia sorghi]